ncbi:NAD(P)H-hydrate epimerase [Pullulanibacillus pueri]|uniref:Bifunctional NAD(P)H-hydrate repair enzyme n=1 Tax=Pullulanibacillus pueri TaxID=1437324 RepID=A0A8J3A059_9BACL|nr:NAD(P)H-hydrate dehydratase [Pullulanibacillus pueri]MBM7683801.1 NAD(P)H-hydrate epimerase [Pullulanibacillus pueri]GGH87637.1 bifunctional NAD(P)H-hydrate repair enzyme [Pullulanibacillus pueri]
MQIVSREGMQAIDRHAIEQIGLSGTLLMENAGRSIFYHLQSILGKEEKIGVIIGKGNNGGDGFVIARHLMNQQYSVEVWVVAEAAALVGDCAYHQKVFERCGGVCHYLSDEGLDALKAAWASWDYIIDALLGTGAKGAPKPPYREVIQAMNLSQTAIISVDLPSGIPANGGHFTHEGVKAEKTLTLQCPKRAQFTYPAANYFGKVTVVDIGIPKCSITVGAEGVSQYTQADFIRSFPKRKRSAHKGDHGRGLMIAGSDRMPGAAVLATRAALRSGTGLLSVNTTESVKAILATQAIEAMFDPFDCTEDATVGEALSKYDAVAFGPGVGRSQQVELTLIRLLEHTKGPLLLDADGLFYLKNHLERLRKRSEPTLLTPHPGEMARLVGKSVREVENDRFGLSRRFAKDYGVYLILKGPFTIITAPDGTQWVNTTGNPALATGGTGDVLTGIVLSFIMQHETLISALCNAVYLHGYAADVLVRSLKGMTGILASDVIHMLPQALGELVPVDK